MQEVVLNFLFLPPASALAKFYRNIISISPAHTVLVNSIFQGQNPPLFRLTATTLTWTAVNLVHPRPATLPNHLLYF